MITNSAYAKVNLTLEITGKREDGYHQISSILQTIDLADMIEFEPADDLLITCKKGKGIDSQLLRQSVLNTIEVLRKETRCKRGAMIRIVRIGIPRAAGLGSSATDTAAILKGLNELWELNLTVRDLTAIAAKLGSDTPFFINGGTALIEGRGETVTQLPSPEPFPILIVCPSIPIVKNKTSMMYGRLPIDSYTEGQITSRLMAHLICSKRISPSQLFNVFETVAFDAFEGLQWYRELLLNFGIERIHLAGAGPALYVMLNNRQQGKDLSQKLTSEGITHFISRSI